MDGPKSQEARGGGAAPRPGGAEPRPHEWRGRAGAIVALAAIVGVFAVLAVQHRWYADETFVAFRQAYNLAHGHGFVWNPGGPAVEATDAPGWVLLVGAAMATRVDPVLFAWYFGAFCGIGVLLLLYAAGRTLLDLPPWWAVVPPALLAAHRFFVTNALGADATRPATLLVLGGTLLLGRLARSESRAGPYAVASGVSFFLGTLLLPVAPLLHLAAAAGLLIARPARERARGVALSLGVHAVLFLGLTIARAAAFGHALPPAATGPLTDGTRYLAAFPLETHGWLWLPLLLGGLALLATRLPDLAAALLVQAVALGALVAARDARGPAFVALDPLLPAFALLLPLALRAILELRGEEPTRRRTVILVVVTLGLVGTQASTLLGPRPLGAATDSGGAAATAPAAPAAPVASPVAAGIPRPAQVQRVADDALGEAQALARHLGPADRIATESRGAIPYVTRAWHEPLRPISRALAARVLAAAIFGQSLFDRPYPPHRVPVAPFAAPPDGTPVYCLQLPAGPRPYWIFASGLPDGEVRAWAAARGLPVIYAEPWRGRSAPGATQAIGAGAAVGAGDAVGSGATGAGAAAGAGDAGGAGDAVGAPPRR